MDYLKSNALNWAKIEKCPATFDFDFYPFELENMPGCQILRQELNQLVDRGDEISWAIIVDLGERCGVFPCLDVE